MTLRITIELAETGSEAKLTSRLRTLATMAEGFVMKGQEGSKEVVNDKQEKVGSLKVEEV